MRTPETKHDIINYLETNDWKHCGQTDEYESYSNSLAFDVDVSDTEVVLIDDNGDFGHRLLAQGGVIDWINSKIQPTANPNSEECEAKPLSRLRPSIWAGQRMIKAKGKAMTDTRFQCTKCGQIGSVGRCCGLDTRIPLNDAARAEIEGAIRLCGEYATSASEGLYASLAISVGRLVNANSEAQAEVERLKKISLTSINNATKLSRAELKAAQRLRKESSPEALESERAANAQLTEELEQARAEIERKDKMIKMLKINTRFDLDLLAADTEKMNAMQDKIEHKDKLIEQMQTALSRITKELEPSGHEISGCMIKACRWCDARAALEAAERGRN